MARAIGQGMLIGIVILIAWYSIRYAGQPHQPSVFYPYNHTPAVHHLRWVPRRWGH